MSRRLCETLLCLLALGLSWTRGARASELEDAWVIPPGQPIAPVPQNPEGVARVATPAPTRPLEHFADQRFALELRTGIASSVGVFGLALDYELEEHVALNAGVGSNLLGWVGEVGVRLRPFVLSAPGGHAVHAMTFELTATRARYWDVVGTFMCDEDCRVPPLSYVNWAQSEVGWEARFGRVQVRTTIGLALPLNDPQGQRLPDLLLVESFAVGYAF
ncbi:MAG TPA: hypothetical protein VGM29_16395 [Polyangiaceae bacterium]|jgi:hypothetical protein